MPTVLNTTNRQLMSRSPHYARTNITSLQIVVPNFYRGVSSPWAEIGSGSAATVTASIEYPIGTMTRVLFSGNVTGTVTDNSYLVSDSVSVTIPNGALFAVRMYWTSTTGVFYVTNGSMAAIGNTGLEMGVSGITDKTMSGNVTGSSNNFPPVAIIGTTTKPSWIIVGDSITFGQGDATLDSTGDQGIAARSIGPYYAYTNLSRSGDQADKFVASHTNAVALFQYASHLGCFYGSNDLYTLGATAAATLTDMQAIWGYMTALGAEKKAYQTTITPRTTSTDSWATTGNQTHTSGTVEARRTSLNNTLRGIPTGLTDCFDVADAIETSRDSGIWRVTGSANGYTADGVHPNTPGSLLVSAAGVIDIRESFLTDAAGPVSDPYSDGGLGTLSDAAGPKH